jgi:hypothetical protein
MPKEFITAAQARLNFCPKLYSEVMANICKDITEASRTERQVFVDCPTKDMTHIRVQEALKEHGFDVHAEKISDDIFNLNVRW